MVVGGMEKNRLTKGSGGERKGFWDKKDSDVEKRDFRVEKIWYGEGV